MRLIEYYRKTYHRVHLEERLMDCRSMIKGDILDIGSKNRRYDFLFSGDITAVDIIPDEGCNVIYGDVVKLEFKSERFDSVMAMEVLEYVRISDLESAVDEMLRVLKKGGVCIIGVPFMCSDHGDRVRLTSSHFKEIISKHDISDLTIYKIGNGYAVCWDIIRSKIVSLKPSFIKKILLPPMVIFFRLVMRIFRLDSKVDNCYLGLFLVIRK